jgi:hypothetical protein
MMRPGGIAREPEVFGDSFVDHFGGTREHEVKLWNAAVTDWESKPYFSSEVTRILLIAPLRLVERYLELA